MTAVATKEVRCYRCDRLLFVVREEGTGKVELVCDRCRAKNVADLNRTVV